MPDINTQINITVYLCVWLGIFGAVWGSFTDCAVSRWAAGERMLPGRSHCAACGHVLGPADLVPVFSFLFHRGRCRHCGERIPADCLAAEILGAAGFALLASRFGPALALGQWLVWWAALLAVFLTDWAKRLIPNSLLLALAANRAVWFFVLRTEPGAALEILKACAIPAALLALVLPAEKLMRREVMGGGDIKLLFALALYLTWARLLLTLLAGCVAGLIFAALTGRKRGDELPFGPFLALGALATVCFGGPLIDWYYSLF